MTKRKEFVFEIEVPGIFGPIFRKVKIYANHLQGAVRQLYQNETKMTRIVRIIKG